MVVIYVLGIMIRVVLMWYVVIGIDNSWCVNYLVGSYSIFRLVVNSISIGLVLVIS